jgi:cellulose synthase/poly-beta-1,6-N-acetylglucosamine synthase-like glycosyltransferase
MQENKPNISVVIPTLNRSEKLSKCLDSLFDQSYPKNRYEIIVGNGSSKDNTEYVLAEYQKKAPCNFSWFTQEHAGISHARNLCISKSKGDIICFIDDDCIAEKNWITNIVGGFSDDTIGAVGGKVISYQTKTPVQEYIEDSEILSQERFMSKNKLITSNAAYRRQILNDIQGFDNFLIACEDVDISIKTQLLGFKLHFVPQAIIYHNHAETVNGLLYRSYRNGRGLVQLHKKYGIHYNLAYNTSISLYRIGAIILRYPITLTSALFTKKNKYYILKPLFEIIRSGGLTWGIVRETLVGEEYTGDRIQSHVDFIEFMDDKSVFALLPKLKKKIFG